MVEEGKPAPDFALESDAGETVRLSELRGKPVVLYFYPKDGTPGCTTQACALRDSYDEFRRRGIEILGVSPDGVDSHVGFREKYGLPFTLLADTELEVTRAYGVLREDAPYPDRSTFVIDENGVVTAVLHQVDPTTHADDVLARFTLR